MEFIKIFNPIFWIFLSYIFGMFGTSFLKLIGVFSSFENHNYISDKLTKRLGVLKFGWLIRHSFMGKFNQNLKFKGKLNKGKLEELKDQMTLAENSHLVAFIFLQIMIVVLYILEIELWQFLVYFVLNIIFNLYLVFLQQYNKRRIDRIIKN